MAYIFLYLLTYFLIKTIIKNIKNKKKTVLIYLHFENNNNYSNSLVSCQFHKADFIYILKKNQSKSHFLIYN